MSRQLRFRPRIETLENRLLLAADIFTGTSASAQSLFPEGEASGEDADDLVEFARLISESGAKLFCGNWAEACTSQLELFEDGGRYLPYTEVTNPNRTINQAGIDAGITSIPTWDFPDGSRVVGGLLLDEIATQLEIAIPKSSLPTVATIPSQTVLFGSPLHIPIDAYDPNGEQLIVTAEVADPELLEVVVIDGNRSLELDIDGYGSMLFELFENRAPRPTSRIVELVEADFFDGMDFHRILEGFVIQGGDPTGTGFGGSTLGNFDDQYHLDLQHNTSGVLSYAKSADDTNDSQFFIADGPLPFLNFEHSVFGTLTEGENVRAAIDLIPTDSQGRPALFPIRINEARIVTDNENSLVMLSPKADAGTTTVTVTITDAAGNEIEQDFQVDLQSDTSNGAPFLNPIPVSGTCRNQIHQLQLSSQDKEGDAPIYDVEAVGTLPADFSIDTETGLFTITPTTDFSGEYLFRGKVTQAAETNTNSGEDNQLFQIIVEDTIYQNQVNSLDVNGDSFLSPVDALIVINELNQGSTSFAQPAFQAPFMDSSGDCQLSPIDALLIINELNSNANGEAEAIPIAESLNSVESNSQTTIEAGFPVSGFASRSVFALNNTAPKSSGELFHHKYLSQQILSAGFTRFCSDDQHSLTQRLAKSQELASDQQSPPLSKAQSVDAAFADDLLLTDPLKTLGFS